MSWCLLLPEAGFLDEVTYDSIVLGPGYDRPYQFDPSVREPKTIQLYKHLNLKSCIWTFDAYYDMTELIDVCGGSVTADFQVRRHILNSSCHPDLCPFSGRPPRCVHEYLLGISVALLCTAKAHFFPPLPREKHICEIYIIHLFWLG